MEPQAEFKRTAEKDVKKFVADWDMPAEVEMASNSMDEMMGEELGGLVAATVLTLILLPTYYKVVYNLGRKSLGGEGMIVAD